jgi:hypothetical protein
VLLGAAALGETRKAIIAIAVKTTATSLRFIGDLQSPER